jgi:2-isopropylmalate synthase
MRRSVEGGVMTDISPRIVKMYETTLRDGEQTPGVHYFSHEKLAIAQALEELGVDTIDSGFPISSESEFKAVSLIASTIEKSEVCASARALPKDIKRAWEAVKHAAHPAIQSFISISPIHREVKLGKKRHEVLEMARMAVALARSFTEDADFALEDATRAEPDFVLEVCEAIQNEGVRFVTVCDTVGYALPWQFGQLIADIRKAFPSLRLSAHCHNDLGLAVANALEALRQGAERVDGCINGLGERAGNAAIEELAMAIRMHCADLGMDVRIDTTKITSVSRLVTKLSGMEVQWSKPVVGKNAFSHGGGIHQDGVLKDIRTYEIMTPEMIGLSAVDRHLHFGKLSGGAALDAKMRDLGYELAEEQLRYALDLAKSLLDKKKVLTEQDMCTLAEKSMRTVG